MEIKVIQKQSQKCPGMYYDPVKEVLVIEGRSIPENPESVYNPLKDWIDEYFRNSESLNMRIILEYINSGSSKHLMEVLKMLKQYQDEGKKLKIRWLYEEDDESILELGEHFRDATGLPVDIEMLIE
ncbi:MAG: DUF1987 domain-containing protein [Bacteroidales bacterium]|nr:DUF1987 domain-containing protein [Bacteroidales bacterium]